MKAFACCLWLLEQSSGVGVASLGKNHANKSMDWPDLTFSSVAKLAHKQQSVLKFSLKNFHFSFFVLKLFGRCIFLQVCYLSFHLHITLLGLSCWVQEDQVSKNNFWLLSCSSHDITFRSMQPQGGSKPCSSICDHAIIYTSGFACIIPNTCQAMDVVFSKQSTNTLLQIFV